MVSLADTPVSIHDVSPSDSAQHHRAEASSSAQRTPQVVILDANRRRAELWGDIVSGNGVRPIYVRAGAAAVSLIEAGQHDCILVGSLTDGSARAFIGWARRSYPTLTLLATADNDERVMELYSAGSDHVFVAPRDTGWLGPIRRLAAYMRLSRAARRSIVAVGTRASAPPSSPDPMPSDFSTAPFSAARTSL